MFSVLGGFLGLEHVCFLDECSQSGTSFPEAGTSLEDVLMYPAADILRERNTGLGANAFSASTEHDSGLASGLA